MDGPLYLVAKNFDQQLKNTENWKPLGKIWFSHSISFEILLKKPQLECQNCQRFKIGNFSTGCNPKAKFSYCVAKFCVVH